MLRTPAWFPVIRFTFVGVVVPLLLLTACGRPPPPPQALKVLREYGWEANVADPQPAWNPASYQVVARSAAGFVLLDEGKGRGQQEYFSSKEKREYHHPAWLDGRRFVVGPSTNVVTTDDGRVVPNTDGVQVFTIQPGRPVATLELGLVGYHPRPWKDRIVVQVDQRIGVYDLNGHMTEFGQGFLAEPQPKGAGLAFQETPVFTPDHWTAKPPLGNLVVRWRPGKIDLIPRAVQPRWTTDGGLIAIQLNKVPVSGRDWWADGTTLVYMAKPGTKMVVLGQNLRNPDPHPQWPLVAATDQDGRVVVISLKDGSQRVIAQQGERPRWSRDGHRLLYEETLLTGSSAGRIYLHVLVLGVENPES